MTLNRLLEPLGYIPPAEAEGNYYKQLSSAPSLSYASNAFMTTRDLTAKRPEAIQNAPRSTNRSHSSAKFVIGPIGNAPHPVFRKSETMFQRQGAGCAAQLDENGGP